MRRDLRNEADWIPSDTIELPAALEELRSRLFDAGRPSSEINGITGWMVAKALGEQDTTAAPTRARYRKILADLGPGPRPNGRARLRDAGDVDQGTLVGTSLIGVAGMAMAMGEPLAAVAAVVVLAAHNARYVK